MTAYLLISTVFYALAAWNAVREGAFTHAAVLAALAVYGAVCSIQFVA
jgi:hypothetical protein